MAAGAISPLAALPPSAPSDSASTPDRVPSFVTLRRYIEAGHDAFAGESSAMRLRALLHTALLNRDLPGSTVIAGISPHAVRSRQISPDLLSAEFATEPSDVRTGWRAWTNSLGKIRRAEFYPLPDQLVRFEVASQSSGTLYYHVGTWNVDFDGENIVAFRPVEEHIASSPQPWFRDISGHALGSNPPLQRQFTRGIPYWRSHLDPALGIDIYGSNGIAVGDIDGDGVDEIYVCQPGGLPNRLLKIRRDGRFDDLTEVWGVGLLDDTSTALFLDLRNTGAQDLVVLRSGGPLLYLHQGSRYTLRTDAFRFQRQPLGGFTGMAAADFDRDGKLDLYLCCYVYFQSEAQFTYPAPYQDAQNGPPNFLFRNRLRPDGRGFLEDCTTETGIDENNNRFSFAPAWCDFNGDGWPDLYVANDFGRKNLYVNRNGKFRDRAMEAGVDDLGPGMSASWFDYDHDGHPDLYVANMWSDAGQRVIHDPAFAPSSESAARQAFQRHTRGNSLYRNRGDETFDDATLVQHAQFGRWAWSSCGADLNNDGEPEIFGTCGMLTNDSPVDLMGFFWRQVVAHSPPSANASPAYQNGWNAINQFIREDYSWNGHEPNVLHQKRGDRYFDYSGVSGLDFADDSRAFALTDFDGDGRLDILLKSRLGPQLRVLQNNCASTNNSLAFSLQGTKSNRDAIGARITVDNQTKWLEAGSGFLSQHTKRLLFGLGERTKAARVEILWPSGDTQQLGSLAAGRTYFVREGFPIIKDELFRQRADLPSKSLATENHLGLNDTWLSEPLPLPETRRGPGLFVLHDGAAVLPASLAAQTLDLSRDAERRQHYEIFRRYLFDYRAPLKLPLTFLLDADGHAVKVYASVPEAPAYRSDFAQIDAHARLALPFPGEYAVPPHRDFAKFGIAFLMSGYPEQALPYFQQVLRRSPDNSRVLTLVGQIELERHRFSEAESCFRKSISAAAPTPEALYGLGLSLARQNQPDDARRSFEQALQLRPNFFEAINDLGALFVQQGKFDDAVAAFRYGIRVAPDEDILYMNLGRTYTKLGQLDKARQLMQDLLDRKPDSQSARHALQELNGR